MLSQFPLITAHAINLSRPSIPMSLTQLYQANQQQQLQLQLQQQQLPQPARVRVRQIRINFRIPAAFIVPLVMAVFRAGVLLSFFPPSREPFWIGGMLLWMVYEVYEILGQAANGQNGNGNGNGQQVGNAAGGQQAAGQRGQGQGQVQGQGAGQQQARVADLGRGRLPANPAQLRARALHYIERVASTGLATEARDLGVVPDPSSSTSASADANANGNGNPPATTTSGTVIPPQPRAPLPPSPNLSLLRKTKLFTTLLVATFVPPVWERRQKALREREMQVKRVYGAQANVNANRVEGGQRVGGEGGEMPDAGAGEGVGEGDRRRAELTGWRRDYVERVLNGDVEYYYAEL